MLVKPHDFTYKTFVKERWNGKTILSVFQKEFRDRAACYYEDAVSRGSILVNGLTCSTSTILSMNDIIEHRIHRHEPAIPHFGPIKWVSANLSTKNENHQLSNVNLDHLILIDKPSGIPVHPTGRYFHNTITEILKFQEGFSHLSNINRLDRPTSGLLLIATDKQTAKKLHKLMEKRTIQKEYLAMVDGEFPLSHSIDTSDNTWIASEGEWISCTHPILTIEHKLGLCGVSDKGKPCKTLFKRLKISSSGNTSRSLVLCKPLTGRTHQIRVHLQHLGFPIVNDLLYGDPIWHKMTIEKKESGIKSWVQDDLYKIAQYLLQRLLPETFADDIKQVKNRFSDSIKKCDSASLPDWFDMECEECQRQWLRTKDRPDIPLIMPIDGSERSAHGIMLHAFKYHTDDWEFQVSIPEWAS